MTQTLVRHMLDNCKYLLRATYQTQKAWWTKPIRSSACREYRSQQTDGCGRNSTVMKGREDGSSQWSAHRVWRLSAVPQNPHKWWGAGGTAAQAKSVSFKFTERHYPKLRWMSQEDSGCQPLTTMCKGTHKHMHIPYIRACEHTQIWVKGYISNHGRLIIWRIWSWILIKPKIRLLEK